MFPPPESMFYASGDFILFTALFLELNRHRKSIEDLLCGWTICGSKWTKNKQREKQ